MAALPSPLFDVTVRVGCSLVYEVTGTASLLLNLQPRPDRNHAVIFEALSLRENILPEKFTDSHGNSVLRVNLLRGTHSIRHDAIVALSSRSDNHDLPAVYPCSMGDLPPRAAPLRAAQPVL